MTYTTTCTDTDLARAIEYAERIIASVVTDDGTILSRALLRLHGERDADHAAHGRLASYLATLPIDDGPDGWPAGEHCADAAVRLMRSALRGRDAYRAHFAADHALRRALSRGGNFTATGELRPDIMAADNARQAALNEVLRVDGEFAREAMREPEQDEGLTLPTLAPDALPTVPGMVDADALLRAAMAERGETAG